MTIYGRCRYARVIDVEFVHAQDVSFFNSETKKDVNLVDFYREKYNWKIKSANQPLLVIENKRQKTQTYLVPELCCMTGYPENLN